MRTSRRYGAFGQFATGIGNTDAGFIMGTGKLLIKVPATMRFVLNGEMPDYLLAKDLILQIIGDISVAGATYRTMEFAGETVQNLTMEERMTLCNMAIEAGARAGLIAVDHKTIDYLQNRPLAPKGELWNQALTFWRSLHSDVDAIFDQTYHFDASHIKPQVTWGTSPEMVSDISGHVPTPSQQTDATKRVAIEQALAYMGLTAGIPMTEIKLDKIFIGSCTNARIEDLRAAAAVIRGRHCAPNIKQALVVPGSGLVKQQAEQEGLDRIFVNAGFEWRDPGCSMCLAMNADRLLPGERCAATSNRNFEGRQGAGGRTHLVSPAMAAAAAIAGHFVDISEF